MSAQPGHDHPPAARWAESREDIAGMVVTDAGAVPLGAGRSWVLWRLQPRVGTQAPS